MSEPMDDQERWRRSMEAIDDGLRCTSNLAIRLQATTAFLLSEAVMELRGINASLEDVDKKLRDIADDINGVEINTR